jgi:hypothetical protein
VIVTGANAVELANAVRTVAAAHAQAGAPQLAELDRAWERVLDVLDQPGVTEELAAVAIEDYVTDSLDAIEEAGR